MGRFNTIHMVDLGVGLGAGIHPQTGIRIMENNVANDNQSGESTGNILEPQVYIGRPAAIFTPMGPCFSNFAHSSLSSYRSSSHGLKLLPSV